MPDFFFDASALAKRWLPEKGTAWVRRVTAHRESRIWISRICPVELVSALSFRVSQGDLSKPDADWAIAELRGHLQGEFVVVELTEALADRAMNLAQQHALKGADAIHLASACEVSEAIRAGGGPGATFVVADRRLRRAAHAEGLTVEDPESHP